MDIAVDSLLGAVTAPRTNEMVTGDVRLVRLLEGVALADDVGVHSFGTGEHHRRDHFDSAPVVILTTAAARTSRTRLRRAVTVLSAADPVRVFDEPATLDLLSGGRAELVVGRGYSLSLQMTNPRLAHDDMLKSIQLLGSKVLPALAGEPAPATAGPVPAQKAS